MCPGVCTTRSPPATGSTAPCANSSDTATLGSFFIANRPATRAIRVERSVRGARPSRR